jgi:hypothetical protein
VSDHEQREHEASDLERVIHLGRYENLSGEILARCRREDICKHLLATCGGRESAR